MGQPWAVAVESDKSMVAPSPIQVGNATSKPGQLQYGTFEAVQLPSGGSDNFPVIIAQGTQDGPVLWITASIHGDEFTGIVVIHELLTQELVSKLRGTIVAVPTLSPAGLRTHARSPYYLKGQDPNRLFPTALPHEQVAAALSNDSEPPRAMEVAYTRLFEQICKTASYLIDLHNYDPGALPFAFRDPIFFHEDEKAAAEQLSQQMDGMLEAFGHTIINEFVTSAYLKRNLHRSLSGAVLHAGRIPAFTAELGGNLTVEPLIVAAALSGLRNALRWAGMLEGAYEPVDQVQMIRPGHAVRRTRHPYAPAAGIIRYLVKSGDPVQAGQPVAILRDIWGKPLTDEEGIVRTQLSGTVLGLTQGATCYQNEALLSIAIRDDQEMMLPFPR